MFQQDRSDVIVINDLGLDERIHVIHVHGEIMCHVHKELYRSFMSDYSSGYIRLHSEVRPTLPTLRNIQ